MSQQINLFNPAFQKVKKIFAAKAMLEALLVLIAGIGLMAFLANQRVAALQKDVNASNAQLQGLQQRLTAVSTELVPRKKDKDLDTQIVQAQTELNALRKVDEILQSGKYGNANGYADYFKAFSRQVGGGVWLTGLSIVGAGNEIALQGRALHAAQVPDMITRLSSEAVMRGKAFDDLQISQATQQQPARKPGGSGETTVQAPYVEFSLQTTLQDDAAKAPER